MNQKLAALIGQHVMKEEPRTICLKTQTRNYDDCDCGYCRPGRLPYHDYPGDMRQAWRVVLRMRELGWQFNLIWRPDENYVYVDFVRPWPEQHSRSTRHADPATAICLAALAALGVPYEEAA